MKWTVLGWSVFAVLLMFVVITDAESVGRRIAHFLWIAWIAACIAFALARSSSKAIEVQSLIVLVVAIVLAMISGIDFGSPHYDEDGVLQDVEFTASFDERSGVAVSVFAAVASGGMGGILLVKFLRHSKRRLPNN